MADFDFEAVVVGAGAVGLALLRLDKAEDARVAGRAITAQNATLSVNTPPVT